MLRKCLCIALFAGLAGSLFVSTSRAQPGQPDRVYYRDKKDGQIKDLPGEIKVSPTGYQVIDGSKKVVATITAADLVRIVPSDIPGYDLKQIMEPVNFEIKKEWEKARVGHAEMLKKASGAPEKIRKYLEFRTAICSARAADDAPDEAVANAKTDEAAKLLDSYLTANKTGWEVWPVAQTLARLQVTSVSKVKDGDKEVDGPRLFSEAARTWSKIAKSDLSTDLKLDASLQEIDLKIRARQAADAKGLIDEAMKTAPAGPVKERLNIYSLAIKFIDNPNPVEGVAVIEAEIEKTKDPSVRAAGHGMAGELFFAADKTRDAMWHYLWVEVVYNQDRDEVIKSMARLADVFRKLGDEDRAKMYRDKARRARGGL